MRDAVIAVDLQNRIIELNTTAQRWLGVGPEVLGANAFEVLQLDEAARQYAEATDVHTEVEIGTGAARRCFDLTISPLRSARGRMVGRVAVMRNITNERALLQAERRRARQMEALNRLTRLTLQTTDFQGLLQMLADQLGDLFGADGAFITLWDEAQQETVPAAAFGNLRGRNPAIRAMPGETTPTESALHAGHQLAIEDVNNTPYLSPRIAAIFPSRSLLALPLIADGQKLGAALIAFEQTHLFTPDELALGEQVTGQISLAIARARLFEELERRAAEAETLRQASAVVVSTLRQEEAIKRILVQLERVVPYDSAAVLLLVSDDEGQQFLEIVGGRGWPDPSVVLGIRFPVPGDNPNTIVIQERRPHILDDAPAVHAPFREDPHSHIRSWMGVPLLVGERTIGMLAVDSIQPHHFTAHHAQLVTAYADQVAIAVRNAQLDQAEEQGRRALAALVEVLQVAGSSLEFKQVLKEIARRTALICSANRCSIFLLDESEERLQPVMSQFADGHVDAEMWEVFRTTTADRVDAVPLFQMAVRERRPAQLDDPARYDLLPRHWTEPFGIQRLLVVPLQYKERVLGALALDQIHIGHMFTQEQVDLAQAVGTQVSSAIVNARLHAKTRARAAEQAALLKISTAISAHLDMEQLLTEMARQTMHALNGTSCYFSFWEPEHQVLRVATEYFGPDANADERVSDLGAAYPLKGGNREYLQSDQPRVKHVSQPKEDPVYAAHLLAYGGKTVLGVPLRVGGELLGELELWDSRTERDFNADELRLVQTIASQAALALQNARLYEAQRTQLRLARTLQEVGALLTAELSLAKVLERLFDLLARVVTYD
ncbi:MAG: GAF domain-containing protein, partial [Anaerolineales bacterium]